MKRKIPIRIKNVQNPRGRGTLISPDPDTDIDLQIEAKPQELNNTLALFPVNGQPYRQQKLPTAVTIKENVIVLNVNSNRKSVSHGFLAGIFTALDRFGIVVDLISTSEVHVSMAISADGISAKVLSSLVSALERNGPVRQFSFFLGVSSFFFFDVVEIRCLSTGTERFCRS
jgi:aspartate kinase